MLITLLLSIITCQLHAQNSVSIGTDDINENAVLQLVSQNNNQGFLVPRSTTAQRGAMQLDAATGISRPQGLAMDIGVYEYYNGIVSVDSANNINKLDDNIKVYPNPSRGIIIIAYEDFSIVELLDLEGKI